MKQTGVKPALKPALDAQMARKIDAYCARQTFCPSARSIFAITLY